MDDADNIGALLKKLDELDANHYASKFNESFVNKNNKMTATQDPALDSNMSDFDNSDEDLASLLGDDDDDIFAKKVYGDSPSETLDAAASISAAKKIDNQTKTLSPKKSVEVPTKKVLKAEDIKESSSDNFDDILDDLIDSTNGSSGNHKSASTKSKTKQNKLFNEGGDTLENLNSSHFSPTDLSLESPSKAIKTSKLIDKRQSSVIDEFKPSGKNAPKPPEGRRGSFFDDFLQKLSPKHGEKKSAVENVVEKSPEVVLENEDDDILSTYIPTAPKNESTINPVIKSPKRRGSLLKQVSFKNLPDDFPENDIPLSKTSISPSKESSRKQSFSEPKTDSTLVQPKRTDKMGANKNEDIDWLNFFKESPKKSKMTEAPKQNDISNAEKIGLQSSNKSKSSLRRQSSADWLGLSDSKVIDEPNNTVDIRSEIKNDDISIPSFKETRPKTADIPTRRSRRQDLHKKVDDDWIAEKNDIIKDNQSSADLSQVLKTTDTGLSENKISSILSTKQTLESVSNAYTVPSERTLLSQGVTEMQGDSFAPSTDFISENMALKAPVPVTGLNASVPMTSLNASVPMTDLNTSYVKEMISQNAQQNYELNASIHSLQQQLDNSMQERNKLMKEIESLKLLNDEQIKRSEEFYKSEKKNLEESFKTLESGLRKESEIKIKSLEERLNLLTEEKNNQEKAFKEKLENIIKEHQTEIQRLKDLHNHSINIMKEDHEEALSRLKRLKEQEVEAVLSSQVHSKSLQHLSDELEARAKELALLQTKVEERNQVTLKERQALLDNKERDLKALQNRLQKQLEESDDERTRLQQLVLRLESRLQRQTMEGEEDRWEVQQMKAKLTVQRKYMEEEQKLNQHQLEKEKEKLRISQDSLLHEQKTVLLQLAQERQQLTQEKIDIKNLAKNIKEEEAKLNVRKLKEESNIESEKQFLIEEKNKLHFEKEKIKQEFYQLERERDTLQREKRQLQSEKEVLHELEINLKRKAAEIEEMAATAAQEQEKSQREHAAALGIKNEHQFKMQQYTQQMQMLMDKERQILSEREKLIEEKVEFEQNKNSILCTKCKLSVGNTIQAPPLEYNLPVIVPVPNINGISNQVQQSFVDPSLVIWQITAQKDREFLQEELSFLKSLKESSKKKSSK